MNENTEPHKRPEVYYFVSENIAFIILDRPEALNALNANMVFLLFTIFKTLEDDPKIHYIVIKSSSDNFSAGGDIKAVYENHTKQKHLQMETFFKIEYSLINKIASSKKTISLVSGISYGAGLALALSCKYSFFSNTSKSSTPEIKIAFYPDAGLCYWLNGGNKKFPGFGMYFGLLAEIMRPSDLESAGLISGVFNHGDTTEIVEALIENQPHNHHELMKTFKPFLQPTILQEIHILREKLAPYAHISSLEALKNLPHFSTSPLSLWATYIHILKTKEKTLRDVLSLDLNLSNIFIKTQDFFEGIRTVIIDRGDLPQFREPLTPEMQNRIINIYADQT